MITFLFTCVIVLALVNALWALEMFKLRQRIEILEGRMIGVRAWLGDLDEAVGSMRGMPSNQGDTGVQGPKGDTGWKHSN